MASVLAVPLYYCYECDRIVRPNSISGLVCPYCNGGFLEECSDPGETNVVPRSWRGFDPSGDRDEDEGLNPFVMFQGLGRGGRYPRGMSFMLDTMSSILQHMHTRQVFDNTDGDDLSTDTALGDINPLLLFQNEMQNMLAGNMDAFMNNRGSRLHGNIGDYFFGPGLDRLIQQLSENDPRHRGAPPASRSAIEALRNINVSEDLLGTDAAQCAVCKDDFELRSRVKQMPCKHMYHSDCILPWLAQHNSCPVCRYELPTNDQEYEEAQRRRSHSTWNSTRGGGQGERERTLSGSSTVVGSRQEPTRRLWNGFDERRDASDQQNMSPAVDSSTDRGGLGTVRRFPLQFPWFRRGAATSQSAAHTQAESSHHAPSSSDSREETTAAFATSRVAEDGGSFLFESWLADIE